MATAVSTRRPAGRQRRTANSRRSQSASVRPAQATGRKKPKSKAQATTASYKLAIKYILCGALILLSIVFLAAYSANLQQKNNKLVAANNTIQAEIDSLNEQINNATSIEKVEKIATEKYGMTPQTAKNYVTIEDGTERTKNLADAIKKEAYN